MIRRARTIRNSTSALVAALAWAVAIPAARADQGVTGAAQVPVASADGRTALIGNSLHLVVGQSMFVNTVDRLRKIYVSNPEVLDSVTASPHQIVVTAKTAGVSSLILWDETGQSQAYEVAADLDVASLRSALKEALPYENISIQSHQDQVSLSGTVSNPAAADEANKLAGEFSKTVVSSLLVAPQHTPQVRLKVRVVEIDRTRAEQLGFNFFTGNGKNTATATTGQFPAVTVTQPQVPSPPAVPGVLGFENVLSLFYYNADLGLGSAIQALINQQIIQILAEPTLSAMSGQKASFLSGGEFPFPVVQPSQTGAIAVTIQFRPYGVRLDFTPNVLPDGTIQLKVSPEVSALDYTNEVNIAGYVIPAIATRRADTEVELKSGQSFAISGLLDRRTTDQLEKIPGIGDIPILGKLFQSKSLNHTQTELAVIVTPTLVDPLSENPEQTPPTMAVPFLNKQKFDHDMPGIVPKTPPAGANNQ